MSKKPVLSAGLVAIKGAAAPAPDMPSRAATPSDVPPPANPERVSSKDLVPLNFSVPPAFKRAYRTFALEHDLKLIDLLRLSFEAYRKQHTE